MSATADRADGSLRSLSQRLSPAVASRGPAGQTVLELAIATPLLLTLLLGVVELGRLAYCAITTTNAARAGVQYGAQSLITASDTVGMQTAALNDAPNLAGMTATASFYCQCANGAASTCKATDCSGSRRLLYVEVDTSYAYTPLAQYPGIPTATTLHGKAVSRVNQ
jgi:Flp pilus assembly protein TadG